MYGISSPIASMRAYRQGSPATGCWPIRGKSLEHNLTLLKHLSAFEALGVPLIVGMSRKSMIGNVLDAPAGERLYGSLSVATLAAWLGAAIVRVHDVRATVDALKMVAAVRAAP